MADRSKRTDAASQTVEILKTGYYTAKESPSSDEILVNLQQVLSEACNNTVLHSQDETLNLSNAISNPRSTEIYVTSETTLQCSRRLYTQQAASNSDDEILIAVLNDGNAKSPGGGYSRGNSGQEEDLACCTGLIACLETAQAKPFYEFHHRMTSSNVNKSKSKVPGTLAGVSGGTSCSPLLFSANMIYSPHVPVFRSDDLDLSLLTQPYTCSIITATAVSFNLGMMSKKIKDTDKLHAYHLMNARALRVLQVAASHGVDILILNAWGCGMSNKNEPKEIAKAFKAALIHPQIEGRFVTVVFCIPESTSSKAYQAFASIFPVRKM